MRTPVKVKICGLTRREDVECAAAAGADYVGFVLVPSSKRFVPPESRRELVADLPAGVKSVAVVADPSEEELLGIRKLFDIIQFHGHEQPDEVIGKRGWKAFPAGTALATFARYRVEHFVIDSDCGGSGRCCDWHRAALAAERYEILLAGGLTPENVAEAIRQVNPWGVDVSGGVELSPGIKSSEKIQRFIEEAKS